MIKQINSIHHKLAKKEKITPADMKGETLMMMQRGWSSSGDRLRDDITAKYPDIQISEFDLYNKEPSEKVQKLIRAIEKVK